MKKKILLFICMFLFIFNVKALTFNVDITNIEDEGNNGTIGSITNIDIPNKTVDAYFQNIGDEVSFSITITNTGDRAGTLRNITFESENDKVEYSSNLPENGLAINGNDINKVIVTAKVKEGAVNGKTSSEIKIKYKYDEGSCPEGEILSDDESMCLCPEGTERNENGICVTPEKPVECAPDEIYNETKKICEKKVVPVNPSNPKTLDNIILITLLFIVSGLGIYAVLFNKLKTNKKKIIVGTTIGVITLSSSITVLIGVFGTDKLLGAIINPITKNKEIIVKVNEEIDLIETWDGDCDITGTLTPDNIFQGGSGTESDPYQIKTANQLACFAKSINEGTTYEGQFIKQIKAIKLNDNLNDQATAGDLSNANIWLTAGGREAGKHFSGTYDGGNHAISGLYLVNDSNPDETYRGMFDYTINATFKNMTLSDVYIQAPVNTGALIGCAYKSLNIDNVTTYGKGVAGTWGAGLVSYINGTNNSETSLIIENTTNNIDFTCGGSCAGIVYKIEGIPNSDEQNMIFRNDVNNGNFSLDSSSNTGGVFGYVSTNGNALYENVGNNGTFTFGNGSHQNMGGITGYASFNKLTVKDSYNTGDWINFGGTQSAGLFGTTNSKIITADNCYNSGNLQFVDAHPEGLPSSPRGLPYCAGLFGYAGVGNDGSFTITNSYNTGDIEGRITYGAGLVGMIQNNASMENCYNEGNITGASYTGGLVGYFKGTINKSYNKGTVTNFGGDRAGGIVGWGEAYIYNSYNAGDVINTAERGNQIAGICPADCYEIKNSYNSGNVTSYYSGMQIAGIQSLPKNNTLIENVYNSGNITFMDTPKPSGNSRTNAEIAGIISASGFTVRNVYNLGNITAYQNNPTADNNKLGGASVSGNVTNAVNTGSITLVVNEPYLTNKYMYLAGISSMGASVNGFNAGTVSVDDSALDHSIYDEEFNGHKHQIILGEITGNGRNGNSNNKFNTNSNGKALGCYGVDGWTSCTLEINEATGTYTTEETPDILSIINGDDAFEIKQGETLPTLKVFNE